MNGQAPPLLEFDDIQGPILRHYGLKYARYLLLRLPNPWSGGAWLEDIQREITTIADWDRTAIAMTKATDDGAKQRPVWTVNVALTAEGLKALALPRPLLQAFSPEFREGMAAHGRPERLGDVGDSAPGRWQIGRPTADGPTGIHVLLWLQGDKRDVVDQEAARLRKRAEEFAIVVVRDECAGKLASGMEHFGFRDLISTPVVEGANEKFVYPPSKADAKHPLKAGEFVLGYPDESGAISGAPMDAKESGPVLAELRRNGSYLVFRKLEQDVAGFRRFLATVGNPNGPGPASHDQQERLAAGLVGRWRSGAPLARFPEDPVRGDPAYFKDHGEEWNTFDFSGDPQGVRVPQGAHIRRTNPREPQDGDGYADGRRHHIIRRGLPYGDEAGDNADDGKERGLMFLAIAARIADQFEYQQEARINGARPLTKNGNILERDPLIGANDGTEQSGYDVGLRTRLGQRVPIVKLQRFVTVRGGAYFFMPGIKALLRLAAIGAGDVDFVAGDRFTTVFHDEMMWVRYSSEGANGGRPPRHDDEHAPPFPVSPDEPDVANDLVGLALSGGGIRSASFSLGVLQAMAEEGALDRVDYLATVSGGSYVGASLSALLHHRALEQVTTPQTETGRPLDRDHAPFQTFVDPTGPHNQAIAASGEHAAVRRMREYSSFLLPGLGLFSLDTWHTIIKLFTRNLLNFFFFWSVVLVFTGPLVMVPRPWDCVVAGSHRIGAAQGGGPPGLEAEACWGWDRLHPLATEWDARTYPTGSAVAPTAGPQAWLSATADGPLVLIPVATTDAPTTVRIKQAALWKSVWVIALPAAMLLASLLGIAYGLPRVRPRAPGVVLTFLSALGTFSAVWLLFVGGLALYQQTIWTAVWNAQLHPILPPAIEQLLHAVSQLAQWDALAPAAGVPTQAAQLQYRFAGIHFVALLATAVLLSIMVPLLALGSVLLRVLLTWPLASAVAPGLLSLVSGFVCFVLGGALLGGIFLVTFSMQDTVPIQIIRWALWLDAAVLLALLYLRNDGFIRLLNAWSLHTFYEEQLAKAFLIREYTPENADALPQPSANRTVQGSADVALAQLQMVKTMVGEDDRPVLARGAPAGPYHLFSASLGFSDATDLQNLGRTAGSFVLAPLYSGSQSTGYVPTAKAYPDLTLGTAMAISGAAFSPNTGASTTPVAILLSAINARLGYWVRHPSKATGTELRRNPWMPTFVYVIKDALGLTNARDPYIHLADGACFDGSGIYELVRRRCRYIIAVDSGDEPSPSKALFATIGSASRLVRVDFGVELTIDLRRLVPNERTGEWPQTNVAVGTITYPPRLRQGMTAEERAAAYRDRHGLLVLVRAALVDGIEQPDIESYRRINPDFPSDTVLDQFFDEPQFEAYRTLGYTTGKRVFADAFVSKAGVPVADDVAFGTLWTKSERQ